MMVPFEASIIPNFHTIRDLGWIDQYTGLTIPFFAMAFGTFLLRQNFKQIPKELREASQIAGMGDVKFYLKVVLPVAKTSLDHLRRVWLFNVLEYVSVAAASYNQ